MYYTYIIESNKSKRWYIGHTSNLSKRISEHNSGYTKSTKHKGPWILIFIKTFDTNIDATKFELKLKRLKNKDYICKVFADYFI